MNRIAIPDTIESSPTTSRPLLEAVKRQLDSVPNLFRLVGNSPAALGGYLGLSGALAKGTLDARTRERVALRVAALNGCDYCLSAHAYLGQNLAGLDPAEVDENREGRSSDPRAAAALRFVSEVMATRGHVPDTSVERVRAAGFDDAQIIELVAHVALNTLTNYVNSVAQTPVDFPRITASAEFEGLCAVAVSMGERVASDASSTSSHAGRLFRFSSPEAKAMFDSDPTSFITKADARWPLR